jgi:SAM-dependent methyltransferase
MLPDLTLMEADARDGADVRAEPADLPERMDAPCTYEEFRACLRDLRRCNRLTQAYRPTIEFLDRAAARGRLPKPLRILDVGSGGGDTLREVARWARRRGIAVELTGIDLNPYAARAAVEFGAKDSPAQEIRWVTGDVLGYAPPEGTDLVLSSLVAHHLSSAEVVRFIAWMEQHAELGWFVNDLRRSARAAFWLRLLALAMRWHPFVVHDGPVSLRRAFREDDWRRLL